MRETESSKRPAVRLSGMLAAAGVLACIATLPGYLGRFHWFLDLFSHFRVQYFLGLLFLTALLLLARSWRVATLTGVFALVCLAGIAPLYVPRAAAAPPSENTLRAVLMNVNTYFGDYAKVREAITALDADIYILQEINDTWIQELSPVMGDWPRVVTVPRDDNFGIGIFSKFPLEENEVKYWGGVEVPRLAGAPPAGYDALGEVPSIVTRVVAGESNFTLITTHPLPPTGAAYCLSRDTQLEKIATYAKKLPGPVMLMGDLNVTPWSHHFKRLVRNSGLLDSARGFGVQPSWPTDYPLLLIPIDHCLHSPEITILDRRRGEDVGSDHYPLVVDFSVGHAIVSR